MIVKFDFFRERELDSRLVVQINNNQLVLTAPNVKDPNSTLGGDRTKNHKFTFDFAHWSHDKQDNSFADQVGRSFQKDVHKSNKQ